LPEAEVLPYASGPSTQHPWDFRLRRGQNWFVIGLNYAAYYFNRYNLSFASSDLCKTFGFTNTEYGAIQSGRSWSYAIGQFFNGLLADRIGGKTTLAIGGYGTALLNVLFGLGFYHQKLGPMFAMLWWYILLRSFDGYVQAFGAPGMVKINAAWFARPERGRFAGIFGLMINLGRFINNSISPLLLAGLTIFSYRFPPGSWQLVFFVPAVFVTLCTTLMLLVTKSTPEHAGYPGAVPLETMDGAGDQPLPLALVLKTILSNPLVWLTAWAYFCTGVVRYGVDDWFPKYFKESRHIALTSSTFQIVGWMIPLVATAGSIISGYVSDLLFGGRRAPVAAFLYFTETVILLIGAHADSLWGVSAALILVAFTCNATHSILGAAAPMDFGGRKMAGFACGVIDSWQYIGAGVAGLGFGALIDHLGWGTWLYAMAGFGILGCALMLIMNRWERRIGQMGLSAA
jgi:MFS transporter, OPA family, glycerol-3-phosphate transporter